MASVPLMQWVPPRNRPAAGRSGLCLRNHLASPLRTARVWLHPRNLLAQCGVTADTLLPVPTRPWPEGLSGPHNSARFHAILPRPGRARNASRDLCGITNLFFKTGGKKKVATHISPETLLTCQIPVVSGKVTHLLLVHLQLGPAVGEDVGQVGRRDHGGGQVCGGRAQAVTGEAGPADPTHRAPAGATRAGGIA